MLGLKFHTIKQESIEPVARKTINKSDDDKIRKQHSIVLQSWI